MIKRLKSYYLLADGAVFLFFQLVPESVIRTEQGRVKLHNWRGFIKLWLTNRKVRLPKNTVYLTVHSSYRGYYHWLLESIPKLLEAKRAALNFTLLLPASYTEAFYADTLRILSIERVERLLSDTVYHVPQGMLPYSAETMGNYSLPALQELKSSMLAATATVAPTVASRLYISRRKASRRKVLNEAEVEQVLAAFGFTILCFEDYTFAEQVQLCANVHILVGLHGAGLSNMVFLQEGATVVEFRKFDNGENYFFQRLAGTLQHTYHLLYCTAADEQQQVQDADLWVDVDALRAVLAQHSV